MACAIFQCFLAQGEKIFNAVTAVSETVLGLWRNVVLFNHLKPKRRPPYLIPSPYREVNTFHLGYKNRSVIMYGAEVAVFSETNTKQIQCGQKVQLLNVEPVGCIT